MKTDTAKELTREETLGQMAAAYLKARRLTKSSNKRGMVVTSVFGFVAGLFALPLRHDPEKMISISRSISAALFQVSLTALLLNVGVIILFTSILGSPALYHLLKLKPKGLQESGVTYFKWILLHFSFICIPFLCFIVCHLAGLILSPDYETFKAIVGSDAAGEIGAYSRIVSLFAFGGYVMYNLQALIYNLFMVVLTIAGIHSTQMSLEDPEEPASRPRTLVETAISVCAETEGVASLWISEDGADILITGDQSIEDGRQIAIDISEQINFRTQEEEDRVEVEVSFFPRHLAERVGFDLVWSKTIETESPQQEPV